MSYDEFTKVVNESTLHNKQDYSKKIDEQLGIKVENLKENKERAKDNFNFNIANKKRVWDNYKSKADKYCNRKKEEHFKDLEDQMLLEKENKLKVKNHNFKLPLDLLKSMIFYIIYKNNLISRLG